MKHLILFLYAVMVVGCQTHLPERPDVPAPDQPTVALIPTATIETKKNITGVTIIPAIGHRGVARIIAALGNDGTVIYSLDGTVTWRNGTPAKLVAFYQGTLIIYRDHEAATRLDRYRIHRNGTAELVETASPSPIAATTIQRTAYAPLGPAHIDANAIQLQSCRIEMNKTVTALAAADRMLPLLGDMTIIVATDDGNILAAPRAYFDEFGCALTPAR